MWQNNKQTTLIFSPFCMAHIGRQHTQQIHLTTTWIFDVWWSGERNSVSLQTVHSLVMSQNHNSGRQVKFTLIHPSILSVFDLIECFFKKHWPANSTKKYFLPEVLKYKFIFQRKIVFYFTNWESILLILLNSVGLCCRHPLPEPLSPPPSAVPLLRLQFMQMTKSSSSVPIF